MQRCANCSVRSASSMASRSFIACCSCDSSISARSSDSPNAFNASLDSSVAPPIFICARARFSAAERPGEPILSLAKRDISCSRCDISRSNARRSAPSGIACSRFARSPSSCNSFFSPAVLPWANFCRHCSVRSDSTPKACSRLGRSPNSVVACLARCQLFPRACCCSVKALTFRLGSPGLRPASVFLREARCNSASSLRS